MKNGPDRFPVFRSPSSVSGFLLFLFWPAQDFSRKRLRRRRLENRQDAKNAKKDISETAGCRSDEKIVTGVREFGHSSFGVVRLGVLGVLAV
jgi:hypothetical protein